MQVFKGGLFKTATEHKEQTRYFSQKVFSENFVNFFSFDMILLMLYCSPSISEYFFHFVTACWLLYMVYRIFKSFLGSRNKDLTFHSLKNSYKRSMISNIICTDSYQLHSLTSMLCIKDYCTMLLQDYFLLYLQKEQGSIMFMLSSSSGHILINLRIFVFKILRIHGLLAI